MKYEWDPKCSRIGCHSLGNVGKKNIRFLLTHHAGSCHLISMCVWGGAVKITLKQPVYHICVDANNLIVLQKMYHFIQYKQYHVHDVSQK